MLTRLEEVCERITVGFVGKMSDQYIDQGVPFLRSQNIQPFRIETEGILFIGDEFHERIKKSALRANDVAVVRTGYPGTAAVVPEELDGSNCADLVVITPGDDLNPHYLAAIFNSTWGKAHVGGRLVGSAQQHFNVGAAKAMEINLPSRPEQDLLAAALNSLTGLIENNRRRIEILEEMARLLYREWFVHFRFPGHEDVEMVDSELGPIPEGWSPEQLGKISEQLDVGERKDGKSTSPSGRVPVVDQSASGFLGYHDDRPGVAASPVDPVFTFANHTCAMRLMMENFSVIQNVFPKVGNPECATTLFAYHSGLERQSTEEYKGHHPRWRETEVALAPFSIQKQFDDLVAPLHRLQWNLVRQNRVLREARDLLLPRLVSGELDVSDLDLGGVLA